jgi:hypothetical protein
MSEPGAKLMLDTLVRLCQGELGEVPLLLSLPVGLT